MLSASLNKTFPSWCVRFAYLIGLRVQSGPGVCCSQRARFVLCLCNGQVRWSPNMICSNKHDLPQDPENDAIAAAAAAAAAESL